jgi:hypothetical protein
VQQAMHGVGGAAAECQQFPSEADSVRGWLEDPDPRVAPVFEFATKGSAAFEGVDMLVCKVGGGHAGVQGTHSLRTRTDLSARGLVLQCG